MTNSPIAALATGMIASRRLDNVPNSEGFRNTFFLSSLLCGNAGAQLVFNMRLADEIGDALRKVDDLQKANKALQDSTGPMTGEIAGLRKKNEELEKENKASQEKAVVITGEIADLRKKKEELEKQNTALKDQLARQEMVILQHPKFSGTPEQGQKLKVEPGSYAPSPDKAARSFSWQFDGTEESKDEEFLLQKKHGGKTLVLVEQVETSAGRVTIATLPVKIP